MLLNRNRAPSPPPDPERTVRLARGHRETHPTGQLRRRIACVFGGFDRSAAGGRGCSRRDRYPGSVPLCSETCFPRGAGAPAERIGYAPQRERRSPRRHLCARRWHGESRAQCRIVPRRVRIANLVRSGNDLVLVAELAGHRRLENRRRYSLPSAADRQAAMGAHGRSAGIRAGDCGRSTPHRSCWRFPIPESHPKINGAAGGDVGGFWDDEPRGRMLVGVSD
jgi:hypothetical protein